ncbi:MAG TPA: hypothetical protein VKC35_02360 [Vicinamibacterales bacterium]|nr:hypothetical protein [Vicinamibacterales bacterium]
MADKPLGFVALKSIKKGPQDPGSTLAQIREIYFKTTKRTIQHDIAHAIELLKSLPTEDERQKAAVYMDGLAQMRSEWAPTEKKKRRT